MNPIQKTARITGFLYLLLVPLGIFGIIYIPSILIVPGDIAATVSRIMANGLLFRLSIVSALLVQLVNIFVVVLLYKLLKPVNKNQAVLMVIFLLLGVPIAFINELTHVAVLLLLSGSDYLAIFTAIFTVEQVHALVALLLELHGSGIFIAQIFWGLWLFPMGYLVFKSGFLPRIIGIFLMIWMFWLSV